MENTRGTREGNLKKVNSKKETIMHLSRGIQQGEETLRIKKNNLLLVKKPCMCIKHEKKSDEVITDMQTCLRRKQRDERILNTGLLKFS